jgi:hypothetical protein
MFVPKLSIGDLNTIVANSEYDNDALTWNVVIPSSIQKKHKVKVIPNSRNADDDFMETDKSLGKKRQTLANAIAKASVVSLETNELQHSNSMPGGLKK